MIDNRRDVFFRRHRDLHVELTFDPEAQRKEPSVIVVMGESGSGKSTIAATLAARHLSEHRTVPS